MGPAVEDPLKGFRVDRLGGLLGGPGAFIWLYKCSCNPLKRPPRRVSQSISGSQVGLELSSTYPGPPVGPIRVSLQGLLGII